MHEGGREGIRGWWVCLVFLKNEKHLVGTYSGYVAVNLDKLKTPKDFNIFLNKVNNFIFSSTAAVYKDGLYKVSENSKLKPKSVYGKTKLKAEKIIKNFCSKEKINYGILRYFNIAGASPTGKIGLINKSDHLFKNFSREIFKKKPFAI